jgi:gliding motility-associated-like protein
VACPFSYSELNYNHSSEWERPTQGTADYFNTCNVVDVGIPTNFVGYQAAYNGNAYAGGYMYASANYREYMMGNLTWLNVGSFYRVTIHVSRAEGERYACDGFGVFFHQYGFGDTNIGSQINVLPQIDYSGYGIITDSVNWVTLKDSFYSDSAYKFIVIGNFHDNLYTNVQAMNLNNAGLNAYYYFDDIRVEPVPPFLTATLSLTNVNCFGGNTGALGAVGHGGTPPYSYLWVPGNYTTNTVSNLTAGTYTLYMTDANNDTFKHIFHVTEPGQTIVNTWQRNISCHSPTGSAAVSVTGGTPPYTFAWTPTGGTNDTATGLAAGNYTCTIVDAHGCPTFQPITIVNASTLAATITQANTQCASTGQLTMNVTGGTQPYHYFWSTGDTTATVDSLTAGSYTCTVYDNDSCSVVQTITITTGVPIVITGTQHNISCAYSAGSATVSVTGGSPPYTYSWAPVTGASPTISNLSTGTYTCTVTDANNCVAQHVFNIIVPPPLTANSTHVNINCNHVSGMATAVPQGGTTPYYYSWSTGDTTATIDGLNAGTYTCNIMDNDSCQTTVTVTIIQTQPISATVNHTDILCFGHHDAQASADVTGGNPPYSYLWSPGNITSPVATGLSAGSYTCTITDADTCSYVTTFTVQDLSVPMEYEVSDSTIDCRTAMVQVNHVSGDTIIGLLWLFNDAGTDTSNESPVVHSFSQDEPNPIRVVLINQIGCHDTLSYNEVLHYGTIANFVYNPPVPKQNKPIYFSNASLGPIVSYEWDFGDSTHSTEENPVKQYDVGGTYVVCLTVTDSIDCSATACKTLTADILKLVAVPSAFTPNGDGHNDVLYMRGFSIKTATMRVYNRYGNMVFETDDINKGWDGTFNGQPAGADVYAYIIDVTYLDNSTEKKHGNVSLLR